MSPIRNLSNINFFVKIIQNPTTLLITLLFIGSALRFYNLNWGAPFYFHPDERNIASSVSQIQVPDQLNPNFFAYGSLPIYTTYFFGVLSNIVPSSLGNENIWAVSFEQAIITGRVLSSILSVGIILLIFFTARQYISSKLSLLTAALTTFSVGLIQYAHFGTFETYLTFFSLLLLYVLLRYISTSYIRYFLYACISLGILIAVKVSSLALAPLPILATLLIIKKKKTFTQKKRFLTVIVAIGTKSMLLVSICVGIFLITNPFAILDWTAFRGSMQYESGVALGSIPVFYTGSFTNTVAGLYQALYVFPFLLNPVIAILFLPASIVVCWYGYKKKNSKVSLLLFFFLFLLIPQLVFFVKWTRYFVPLLPIIYLLITIALSLLPTTPAAKRAYTLTIWAIIIAGVVWTVALMKTVYVDQDTRVAAADFAQQSLPRDTPVLSEVYDLGIVPFNDIFSHITLFNFYDLEHDPNLESQLRHELSNHDVLILPSQRIIKSRLEHPEDFPVGNNFYTSLLSQSHFTQIYQTHCDILCRILYLGDPIYGVEDTTNVFDRPTLFIYRINHEI